MMPRFINEGFLGCLFLAVIPIIIYLINRQRYRRVRWAAMDFLLRAMQKNRRRLRLENLILLLIRTAMILLLVLAFSRPIFEAGELPVLGAQNRTELLVVDRSYSMAAREGSRAVLVTALGLAKERLGALGKGDRVGLFLGGGFPEVVFTQPQYVTDELRARLLEQLDEVEVAYEPLDVAATLQAAAAWAESAGAAAGVSLHLYSDQQRRDWLASDGSRDAAIDEALARLRQLGIRVQVHPLGATKPRNATVTDLGCAHALLCVDLPTSFQVRVDNRGADAIAGLEVELWIDDVLQGSRKVNLDPGESKEVGFPYVFRQTELARVKALLKSDDLEEDNARHGVFPVRDAVKVLVVDGGEEGADEGSEVDFLVPAIGADLTTPGATERLTPFRCDVIASERLAVTPLAPYAVVVLADVGTLSEEDSRQLEAFLRAGGGVLLFLGKRCDPESWRRLAFRDGDGWLPYVPGKAFEDLREETAYRLDIVQKDHPALCYLANVPEVGLSLVRIWGYRLVEGEVPEAHVLARLDDFRATPLVVEQGHGEGVAVAINTSSNRDWSNLPITPVFVCLVQELLPYLAVRADVPRILAINEPFQRIVPSSEYAQRLFLFAPDGTSNVLLLKERADGRSFQLDVPGQRQPGSWEIRFGGQSDDDAFRAEWFAVNAAPEEGFLLRAEAEELTEAYGAESLSFSRLERAGGGEEESHAESGEIWRSLMWAVLFLLLLESGVARWFGGRGGKA